MIPRQSISELYDPSTLRDSDRRRAMAAARRLHRLSGAARIVYRHIDRHASLNNGRLQVLVMPCTDLQIPLSWALRSLKTGVEIDYVLANGNQDDSHRDKINRIAAQGASIECIDLDERTAVPSGFDLIVSMYDMHLLREDQAFRRLQSMITSSDGRLIVCDYARSSANAWLARIASQVVSRNSLARQSAVNEVLAAFSVDEFQRVAEDALVRPVKVEPLFPCHFLLACEEMAIPAPVPAFA